jgi:hypothetical protein
MQFFLMVGDSPELDRQFSMFAYRARCSATSRTLQEIAEWVPGTVIRDIALVR